MIYSLSFSLPYSSPCFFLSYCTDLLFFFLWPHLWHMEVPGPEVELELPPWPQPVTGTLNLSWICDLHHSLQQHEILSTLSKARDWTCVLTDNIWSLTDGATTGTPTLAFLLCLQKEEPAPILVFHLPGKPFLQVIVCVFLLLPQWGLLWPLTLNERMPSLFSLSLLHTLFKSLYCIYIYLIFAFRAKM